MPLDSRTTLNRADYLFGSDHKHNKNKQMNGTTRGNVPMDEPDEFHHRRRHHHPDDAAFHTGPWLYLRIQDLQGVLLNAETASQARATVRITRQGRWQATSKLSSRMFLYPQSIEQQRTAKQHKKPSAVKPYYTAWHTDLGDEVILAVPWKKNTTKTHGDNDNDDTYNNVSPQDPDQDILQFHVALTLSSGTILQVGVCSCAADFLAVERYVELELIRTGSFDPRVDLAKGAAIRVLVHTSEDRDDTDGVRTTQRQANVDDDVYFGNTYFTYETDTLMDQMLEQFNCEGGEHSFTELLLHVSENNQWLLGWQRPQQEQEQPQQEQKEESKNLIEI